MYGCNLKMSGKPAVNFDDIMFTSIDSEDFLDNEEKPSLTSSWSSESEKDCQWKSSNSSLSQLQSPPKQSDLPACSTPVNFKSSNNPKFLTCHEVSVDNNTKSLSGVDISQILTKTPNGMNHFTSSPNPRSRRSLSLHDLDNVFEFPSNKLAKNAVSCEMSHSLASSKTRSKDSGIHRTASCVSLLSNNTYNRKYDHVQSKVKQYIQSMKELGSKNRQSKNITKPFVSNNSESRISSDTFELTEEKFNELKNELAEKDLLISTYHEKYMDLQIKYVNLKQKFDALRFGSVYQDRSLSPDQLYYSAEEPFKPDLSNLMLSNCTYQTCSSAQPVSPSNTKALKPLTKFHSTSVNLSRHFVPLQSVQTNKNSSQSTEMSRGSTIKPCPNSQFDLLESSEVKEVDPYLKVKRWQESLLSSKTQDIDIVKCNYVNRHTDDSTRPAAQESEVQIFNSLPLNLPQKSADIRRSTSNHSAGNENKFIPFKESMPELSSYKFVKLVSGDHEREHAQAGKILSGKPETITEFHDKFNPLSSKEKDENFNVKSFLTSHLPKQNKCDEPDMSWNSSLAASAERTHQKEPEKIALKKSRPRRKTRRSKHGGEVPDVLLNLTKENPSSVEDLRDIDDTCKTIKPISMKNVFKSVLDSSDSLRSIPKPDMLPFASSTMENNVNIRKFYASKNSTSSKYEENTTNQKSSHVLVPTIFSSPKSGASLANISNDKSNKSALCCCLETSDMYINQLNEGLDKLMIALTELGTSTVFKS